MNVDGDEKELSDNISTLNTTLEKDGSFRRVFGKGIIYGIGFVLGSTILAAVVVSILFHLFRNVPIVGQLIDSAQTKILQK